MSLRCTHLRHGHTAASLAARAGKGFTLIETLVAIGAVALVAVGLAAIFDSVGKTVTGGRRASRLTSYASIIEGQFRKDFDAMIHDKGVLVIRQNVVQIGTTSEVRRADEITFFARGDFKSVRTPIHPNRVPTSDTALIYYGHGVKQTPSYTAGMGNAYLYPTVGPYEEPTRTLSMRAPDRLGSVKDDTRYPTTSSGTNAKSSEWTLLRHATLLVKPQLDLNATGTNGTNGQRRSEDRPLVIDQLGLSAQPGRIDDTSTQFELQPAAPSIFRNVARAMNGAAASERYAPADGLIRLRRTPEEGVPSRSSGIVDVATGDLDEVRGFIETGFAVPGAAAQSVGWIPAEVQANARRLFGDPNPVPLTNVVLRPFGRFDLAAIPPVSGAQPGRRSAYGTGNYNAVDRMHAWMNDLFPAQSDMNDAFGGNNYGAAFAPGSFRKEAEGERMRYEPTGPGLLDVTDPTNQDLMNGSFQNDPAMMRSLQGDQVAISSSIFLPRCTNFIVEWSFGETLDQDLTHISDGTMKAGDMLWYGPERRTSSTFPNTAGFDVLHAVPYPFLDDANIARRGYLQPFTTREGKQRFYEVSDFLIYGMRAATIPTTLQGVARPFRGPRSLTSYFGYVDPTFDATEPERVPNGQSYTWAYDASTGNVVNVRPTAGANGDEDRDGNKANDPTDSASASMPWAWPKLIRITVTLADPRQKDVEETFQYVFRVPERGQ